MFPHRPHRAAVVDTLPHRPHRVALVATHLLVPQRAAVVTTHMPVPQRIAVATVAMLPPTPLHPPASALCPRVVVCHAVATMPRSVHPGHGSARRRQRAVSVLQSGCRTHHRLRRLLAHLPRLRRLLGHLPHHPPRGQMRSQLGLWIVRCNWHASWLAKASVASPSSEAWRPL